MQGITNEQTNLEPSQLNRNHRGCCGDCGDGLAAAGGGGVKSMNERKLKQELEKAARGINVFLDGFEKSWGEAAKAAAVALNAQTLKMNQALEVFRSQDFDFETTFFSPPITNDNAEVFRAGKE